MDHTFIVMLGNCLWWNKKMSIRDNINEVIAKQTARIMKENNIGYDEALEKVNKSLKTLGFYIQNENDLKVIETLVERLL